MRIKENHDRFHPQYRFQLSRFPQESSGAKSARLRNYTDDEERPRSEPIGLPARITRKGPSISSFAASFYPHPPRKEEEKHVRENKFALAISQGLNGHAAEAFERPSIGP
ncbi:hypothetical protein KM043_005046 [Ampulex compressa]|nr:hypothetical protein KM043_005046 [Ampulex compressa]